MIKRLWPLLLAASCSGATAAGFLVSGGTMASSVFCRVYGCSVAGTASGVKAYKLKQNPAVGVVSQVSGGRVNRMSFVLQNPDKVSDRLLAQAISSALPDFQVASLGARHPFKMSVVCLKSPTPGKTVRLNGRNFSFSCTYGPQAKVAALYKLPARTPLIVVSYTRK